MDDAPEMMRATEKMRKLDHMKAVVLFSGGQDSSIALVWALERYDHVATVGFDYGQRHAIELGARRMVRRRLIDAAPQWRDKLGDDHMIGAGAFKDIGDTAMTSDQAINMGEEGLPTTFVPGRNLAFLVLAGGLAYRIGAGVLVAGMCETDYSGYPDCREAALSAQMEALRLGMDTDIRLETPLMHLSKGESWRLAEDLADRDVVDLINEHSHSCYRGVRATRHDWGYGCGDCPACELRAKGWAEFRAAS